MSKGKNKPSGKKKKKKQASEERPKKARDFKGQTPNSKKKRGVLQGGPWENKEGPRERRGRGGGKSGCQVNKGNLSKKRAAGKKWQYRENGRVERIWVHWHKNRRTEMGGEEPRKNGPSKIVRGV